MTVNEQFLSIVIMTFSGVLVGAVVDATRIYISALSPKSFLRKFTVPLEILIWALLGAGTFYIIFLIKGGEWRLVDPLSQILGIFLYESFFQPFFRFLGRLLIILIINPIIAIIHFIINAIRTILVLIIRILVILLSSFYKIFAIIKKYFHKKFTNVKKGIFKKR